MQPLRALTPQGGAYLNEADVYEPNASTSFWGSDNYAKLWAVKQKYDPKGLLDCYHCGESCLLCRLRWLIIGFAMLVGWKGKNTPIASCYF
ncbi:hypothetical protein FRC08_002213 [Ceratobasidium sp. 394]|nr:hypothetical protein FRC08_002213 [Ceratobasidium sp. 394]